MGESFFSFIHADDEDCVSFGGRRRAGGGVVATTEKVFPPSKLSGRSFLPLSKERFEGKNQRQPGRRLAERRLRRVLDRTDQLASHGSLKSTG